MKILHTADWHLGTFRSPVKDGVNLRTEDTKRCLDELIRVANEEKPDYSLVSGDIFHVGRLWSDRCCEEIITAIHYIRELAAVSKQVVVMRGTPNHDGSGQFNVLSEMFADVPNVHVVITPQVISFDDVDIAVLPGFDRGVFRANHPGLSSDEENVVFTNELSNIVTGLKAQCSPEKKSILMAHYTVPGCNTESGQTMMLTQFEPIIPQEALLAANYNLVALGHIHRPQKIMHRDWYYSGAINVELTLNYEENGLFAKIIDIPSDDAVSSGFEYGVNDVDLETFINDSLDELDFEGAASTAIKWSRLYGGSLMVMIIDDGKQIDEPVDWDNIRGIDELLVFERPLITPDYNSIYNHDPKTGKWSKFGKPEFYDISPMYGRQFRVHESRCLLFKNGTLPQSSSRTEYRFFGMPEYTRIHKALQETVTSHGNGVKLLDRAVQAIYKMNDLANLLETDEGEDIVLRRLRIIDMAKGIINSIAIDANGEDYDYKTVTFSGVKDIIDATCNMLSAVTNIPQTKLFGRSPAGENSTGEGDMENYYSYVNKIQKLNLKRNLGVLIDIILIAGKYKGEFEEIPDYTLKFKPLWNLSEAEQAGVDQTKAATELTKAQTAQVYVDMQALDASEVRKRLAENGEFTVNDILDDEDDWEAMVDDAPVNANESAETSNTALSAETKAPKEQEETETDSATDTTIPTGCGVIVVKDGKVLVGTRKDNGLVCGPGGHIEIGETPEDAAIRETREEFGINIANIIPVTLISGMSEQYCPSQVFLCTEYYGNPICFNTEMEDARFEDVGSVLDMDLFLPFRLSLEDFLRQLDEIRLTAEVSQSNMEADGGPGSGRYPKGSGKKNEKSGSKKKKSQSLPMTAKEKAKVTHDINNVYHAKYKGKSSCYIRTHSNEPDSPAYVYRFRNHGFDDYEIYMKESTD